MPWGALLGDLKEQVGDRFIVGKISVRVKTDFIVHNQLNLFNSIQKKREAKGREIAGILTNMSPA